MSPPRPPERFESPLGSIHLNRRTLLAAAGIAAGIAVVGHGVLIGESAAAAITAANGYIYPTDPFQASTEAAGQFNAPRTSTRRHMGLDTWGYRGMPVVAIAAGKIVGGDWNSTPSDGHGWGHFVTVDHGNGVVSRYAHFEGAPVVAAQGFVTQGQTLGYMGNSQYGPRNGGMGVHLHFEVLVNGAFVSPLAFLQGNSTSPITGVNPDPGYDLSAIYRRNNNMASLFHLRNFDGTNTWALAGDGVGSAAWLEITDVNVANGLANQHGNAVSINWDTWQIWKAAYLSKQPVATT